MNARQKAKANALLGASEYAATRAIDFTHAPLTKVDVKFASAVAMINTSIEELGGKQSIQSGRAFLQESAEQAMLREELDDYLSDLNFTVATIAEEFENPAIKARFRTADSRGDGQLSATALGMAAAIEELSLNDELESHGYPADTAAHLKALVREFKASEADQGRTLGNQAGATAAIPGVLRKGGTGIKIISSIFRRVYKDNIEVLTAWETASHVERSPKAAAATTPAPAISN